MEVIPLGLCRMSLERPVSPLSLLAMLYLTLFYQATVHLIYVYIYGL
jgi:hypothetical protein